MTDYAQPPLRQSEIDADEQARDIPKKEKPAQKEKNIRSIVSSAQPRPEPSKAARSHLDQKNVGCGWVEFGKGEGVGVWGGCSVGGGGGCGGGGGGSRVYSKRCAAP